MSSYETFSTLYPILGYIKIIVNFKKMNMYFVYFLTIIKQNYKLIQKILFQVIDIVNTPEKYKG